MSRTARAVVQQKQAKAVQLLRDGHSYDEIAAHLGYTNRGAAWRLVRNALAREVDLSAQEYLQLSLDRLDAILCGWWEQATTGGDYAAARTVLRVIEDQCRLLGLLNSSKASSSKKAAPDRPWGIIMSEEDQRYWEDHGGLPMLRG
jgi:hypothetical protein